MTTKEQILESALYLFSEYGIRATPLSHIARDVGIKKPSIYNHFESKESLVQSMYQHFRKKAVNNSESSLEDILDMVHDKEAGFILKYVVKNYEAMYQDTISKAFWKMIHSEKFHDDTAFTIVTEETERMYQATTYLFRALKKAGRLDASMTLEQRITAFVFGMQSILEMQLMHESHNRLEISFKGHMDRLIECVS